jgi:YD repeat-containing protein
LARVTKITNWIDGTNGLRYGYDDAGRLTSITDYDDSTLTYAYDAAGNVTSMTDYSTGWGLAKPVGRQRLEQLGPFRRASPFFPLFPQYGVDPIHTGGQDQGVRREWATNDS